MRGFQYAGIGPRDDSSGYALGGQTYAIGSVEFGVPNGLPDQYGLKTALFIDVGTLGGLDKALKYHTTAGTYTTGSYSGQVYAIGDLNKDIHDDMAVRASAGVTIRWKSPMGPVQFDLSQVIAKTTYDKTENFRFSQSTQF